MDQCSEVVIVLADDNHSLDDDYPLQPIPSKQVAKEEVPRGSASYGVRWVYDVNRVNTRLRKSYFFFFVYISQGARKEKK